MFPSYCLFSSSNTLNLFLPHKAMFTNVRYVFELTRFSYLLIQHRLVATHYGAYLTPCLWVVLYEPMLQNPSFSLSYIRELTIVFHDKSQEVNPLNLWAVFFSTNEYRIAPGYLAEASSWKWRRIQYRCHDVAQQSYTRYHWTCRYFETCQFTNIVLTCLPVGFNYKFNSLNSNGEDNELISAWKTITRQGQGFAILNILQAFLPPLRIIVCHSLSLILMVIHTFSLADPTEAKYPKCRQSPEPYRQDSCRWWQEGYSRHGRRSGKIRLWGDTYREEEHRNTWCSKPPDGCEYGNRPVGKSKTVRCRRFGTYVDLTMTSTILLRDTYETARNSNVPCCWKWNDICSYGLVPVRPLPRLRRSKQTPRGASYPRDWYSYHGETQFSAILGRSRTRDSETVSASVLHC